MIYGDMKLGIKTVLQFFSLVIIMTVMAFRGVDEWMILAIGIWGIMFFICLANIRKNAFFLFFLLSFFIFLMSGDIAELLFDKHYYLQFDKSATLHAHKCLCISMVGLWIGYIFTKVSTVSTGMGKIDNSDNTINGIKQFSKLLYMVSYVLILSNTIDTVRFVASYGYVAYYTSFNSFLPSILVKIGEFTPLILCVYLSTFPTKKEASFIIRSFLIYSFLTLFVGSRSGIIYNTAFIICYCLYRNYTDRGTEIWISKKLIFILVLSVPFLLSFLFSYEYIRTGRDIEYESFGESIIDFFINIGASSKVIKYGYEYANRIPKWNFYSLGETLNYFKYGTLFNLFNLNDIPARHTAAFALNSHSLGDLISYLAIPQKYLNGNGTGSSFIAELFADFGYVGVALGSAIYGWLFKKISCMGNEHWLSTTIKLFVFFTMLSAPRGSFDGFIAAVLNINHILLILLIYLLAKSYKNKKNNPVSKRRAVS